MHWQLNQKSNGMSIIPSVIATLFVMFHDNTSVHISQWLSHVVVNVVVVVIIYSVPHYKTGFLIFGHLVDYLQNHAISTHNTSK